MQAGYDIYAGQPDPLRHRHQRGLENRAASPATIEDISRRLAGSLRSRSMS